VLISWQKPKSEKTSNSSPAIELGMKIWQMRRNCALTPKQLLQFYIALVCLSFVVAIGFLLAGVWVIPIFTIVEIAAVTIGFLIYCRHALDSETIEIDGKRLIVKKFIGYKEKVYEFNTQWAKIEVPLEDAKTFFISQSNLRVEIGQFIRQEQQLPLIAAVRRYLG
jgi:uncharacterized membrane protein